MNFGDARHGGEAVGYHVVGVVVELVDRRVAGEEDVGNGRRVDVGLDNHRPVGVRRQLIQHHVQLLADILRGHVDINVNVELQHHLVDVLKAGGLDMLETVDSRDGVLDMLADVLLDVLCRGTDPGGDNCDIGDVDLRHALQRHLAVGVQPKGDQCDEQAAHRDRSFGGCGS